jgi:hypothetical protein
MTDLVNYTLGTNLASENLSALPGDDAVVA